MEKYFDLLGLHLDSVKQSFETKGINYHITEIQGKKDRDRLKIPKVIKIIDLDETSVEIIITYFSDSLY